MNNLVWLAALMISFLASTATAQVRIKDVTSVRDGVNRFLVGYGLVVGLQGTGDTPRNSVFTRQSMQSMLSRLGVNVDQQGLQARNVAAVLVTAQASALANGGGKLDVTISSLGDSSSLKGGTLVMTPLQASDGVTYAVAQGQVAVSGFAAQGQAEAISQGVPTTGRIANGAVLERPLPAVKAPRDLILLDLTNPDFATSVAIVDAINAFSQERYKQRLAREIDAGSISVTRPGAVSRVRLLAEIGGLAITPDIPARIVIDARSGTVVIGAGVQILPVAVTHGNLTVRVAEAPLVAQPAPMSEGETVVVPRTTIEVGQPGGSFVGLGGGDLRTLIRGLNSVGVKPDGVIAILQAIRTAGALQAELVVQ